MRRSGFLRLAAAPTALLSVLLLSACATPGTGATDGAGTAGTDRAENGDERPPYGSTYVPPAHDPVLIRGATVLTGTGERLDDADVLLVEHRVAGVGPGLDAPAGARVIEAEGRWVTPGLIDAHSHLGSSAAPVDGMHSDTNEVTAPETAHVWVEHSVWPQDPQFPLALAGGITSLQILPGSANLFGGRGVTLKNVPARSVMDMKFPGAPHSLKMACGENPKRVYGRGKGRAPYARMGNVAGYREAWIGAQSYLEELQGGDPPERDLGQETLAGVLRGEILVHNHCYRADEMAVMLEVAREFGYRVTAFHHATEAYKIADLLAENDVCAAMWSDWMGFKLEANDAILENIALVDAAGACAIVHSDDPRGIQRLNQEAGKAMMAGRRMGLDIPPERAIRWLTHNPARALGILDETGTLEPGKAADVVLWNGNPFSVYALAQQVWIDGVLRYDRSDPQRRPRTDFDLFYTAEDKAEWEEPR